MPSGKCHFFTFIRRNNDSRHLIWLIKCDFFLLCSTLYFGKTSIFFFLVGASRGKNSMCFCSLWQCRLWSFQVRDTNLEFKAPHYTNLQISMISFDYSWFLGKNLSNFVSLPWKLHNWYFHNVSVLATRARASEPVKGLLEREKLQLMLLLLYFCLFKLYMFSWVHNTDLPMNVKLLFHKEKV